MTLPEFLSTIQTVSTFSKTMPVYYIVNYFKEVCLLYWQWGRLVMELRPG